MRFAAVLLFVVLAACATIQTPTTAPQWDAVPPGIAAALCQRLQSDRFADTLVMVKITQPIVTSPALSALYPMKRRPREVPVPPTRAIPIEVSAGCNWKSIDAAQKPRYHDAVVVELSSPILNPADPKEAGLFARTTIGGAHEWYWIALRQRGGAWELAGIGPIGV